MSTSELADLEALLIRVLPDPMGFAERVFQEMAGRLATDTSDGEQPWVVPSDQSSAHEALVDRNVLLAAALGACDCWGQDPECLTCSGEGSAGWIQPERGLYDEYVEPANVRMAGEGGSTSSIPHDEQPAEGGPG
jgi:hypothetical protein